jgi:hypothetical protein
MKRRIIIIVIALGLALMPALATAETRTYTEKVTVKVDDDEYTALGKAKEKAREQALRNYLNDVYKDRSATLNLTGDENYIQDLEVVESSATGLFSKELTAKIRVTINEEAVRAYLKRQGVVTGKNDDRRIFVILIPGKMDTGDAPVILDNIRAEIRKKLTAAEYTVIDSEEQVKRLESLAEEADYNKLIGQLDGLGEWVVVGKVDTDITEDGSMLSYHIMMTGKTVSIANRDALWEGNIDGLARVKAGESPKAALRLAAINGGKSFADEVVKAMNTKTLTQERSGSRFEVVVTAGGDYKLERKILKILKEDIKGLKNVSQKKRGKGDMVVDLFYVGKISDLVDLLLDNFEKDSQLKRFSPEIDGNKVIFKK